MPAQADSISPMTMPVAIADSLLPQAAPQADSVAGARLPEPFAPLLDTLRIQRLQDAGI